MWMEQVTSSKHYIDNYCYISPLSSEFQLLPGVIPSAVQDISAHISRSPYRQTDRQTSINTLTNHQRRSLLLESVGRQSVDSDRPNLKWRRQLLSIYNPNETICLNA